MNLELLIASKNLGKVREFKRQLLVDLPIILHSANEFEEIPNPKKQAKLLLIMRF